MKQSHATCLLLLALVSGAACAQNPAADIEAELKGKKLFLGGGWAKNKLAFDGDGQPEKDYGVLPFTLSGFEERSVTLKGDTLKIEGKRIGLRFDNHGKESRSELGSMTIEIKGHAGIDFHQAVNQIFAQSLAALVPNLPSFWKSYAAQHFMVHSATVAVNPTTAVNLGASSMDKVLHIGGPVLKPKVLSMPDAKYSKLAADAGYSGDVEVYLRVGVDGLPSHLQLVRPAGMGLDEEAIAAVAQYRFSPATKDGKPVSVDLYIDVNFQRI